MNLHIARNNADSQKRQIEHHVKWGMAHIYGPRNVHEGEYAHTDARRYTVTAIHHERFTGRDDDGNTAKIPYTHILHTYPGPAKATADSEESE